MKVLLIILTFLVVGLAASNEALGEEKLTPEQTVTMVMHAPKNCLVKYYTDLLMKGNPDALKGIYDILNNSSKKENWEPAILMIGAIGKDDDVQKLTDFLQNRTGTIPEQSRAVEAVFIGLGLMQKRGIGKARESLAKMSSASYWEGVRFRLHPELPDSFSFQTEMLYSVLCGRIWAHESNFEQIAAEAYETIKDPNQRKLFGLAVPALLKLDKEISAPPKKASDVLNRDLERMQQGKFSGVGPTHTLKTALSEYAAIDEALKHENWEYIVRHIADKGKPMLPPNESSDAAKQVLLARFKEPIFMKAFEGEKEMLLKLKSENKELSAGEVITVSSNTFVEKFRGASEFLVDTTDSTVVRFTINDSVEIGKSYIPPGTRSVALAQDRNLIVYMIRVDGVWFWNPFGW